MFNIIKDIFNKLAQMNKKNVYVFIIILFFLLPITGILFPLQNYDLFNLAGEREKIDNPKFSIKSYNEKNFQKQFEKKLGYSLLLTNLYIKNFNTVMFYVFNKSYADNGILIIGKDKCIFGTHYFAFYMSDLRYRKIETEKMQQTINDFKIFQDYLKRKNKLLIVLVTPNKTVFYKDYLPNRYQKNDNNRREDKDYYVFKKMLKKSGLNYVDSRDYLNQIKNKNELFEKDDLSWSYPTAFVITQKIIDKINLLTDYNIKPLKINKVIKHDEIRPKSFAADLLNIFNTPKGYSYKEVVPIQNIKGSKKKLAIIGGCYTDKVVPILSSANTFNGIENYNAASIMYINNINYGISHSNDYKNDPTQENCRMTEHDQVMKNIFTTIQNSANLHSPIENYDMSKMTPFNKIKYDIYYRNDYKHRITNDIPPTQNVFQTILNSANLFNDDEKYNTSCLSCLKKVRYCVDNYKNINLEENETTDINHLMEKILKNDIIVVDFNESFILHDFLDTYVPAMKKYMKENP